MKNWYQSKTIWIALLQAVAGLVVAFQMQYPSVGVLLILKSVVDVTLRFVTTAPVQ